MVHINVISILIIRITKKQNTEDGNVVFVMKFLILVQN